MRSALTGYVCRPDTPTFGVDGDGDPLPKPPFVLIVVGGGPNTYQLVFHHLQASICTALAPAQPLAHAPPTPDERPACLPACHRLQNSRPVVCLPDSGGAAFNIYQYVTSGGSYDGARHRSAHRSFWDLGETTLRLPP